MKGGKEIFPYSRMPTNKHRNNSKVTKLSLQNFQKLIPKYHSGLLLSEKVRKTEYFM